jgi:hypothetical protein
MKNINTTYVIRFIGITGNTDTEIKDYLAEDITGRIGTKQYVGHSVLSTLDKAHRFTDLSAACNLLHDLNSKKLIGNNSSKANATDITCTIKQIQETTEITDISASDINSIKVEENNRKIRQLQQENMKLGGDTPRFADNGFFSQSEMNNLFGNKKEKRELKNDENSLRDAPELELNAATLSDIIKFAAKTFNTK